MDRNNIQKDSITNLASLEEHYTDFDHWLISLRRYQIQRSFAETRRNESQNFDVTRNSKWQLLLVQGIDMEGKLRKNIINEIFTINKDSLNYDHVIFELIRNRNNILYQYTKSKL